MTRLTALGDEIWIAEGHDCVEVLGFRYPTRMAVIRLNGGDLFIWSPVALTPDLCAEVDALGRVRFLIAPNALHHLFLSEWAAFYPDAEIHAAPRLSSKRRDITFTATLDDTTPAPWQDDIGQVVVGGNLITTEVVFFHMASRTVLVTDLIQHFPTGWFSGWRAVIARLDLMSAKQPSVPRKFRLAFTNRRAAKDAIARVLDWPASNLVIAHGPPVRGGADIALRRAFGWLF